MFEFFPFCAQHLYSGTIRNWNVLQTLSLSGFHITVIAFCFRFNINVTSLLAAGIFCVKSGFLLQEKKRKIQKNGL